MTMQVEEFKKALLSLNRLEIKNVIEQAGRDHTPFQCVEGLALPALTQIGDGWEQGSISLSQVYMSGRICEELVDTILPPADPERIGLPPMAITTLNDYHALGKRIIYSALRASGFELLDYGRCAADELVGKVAQDRVKILLVSVLMLSSALRVKDLKERFSRSGLDVKVVVGGAPFRLDKDLWKEVGADATGGSVSDAVKILARMREELTRGQS